MRDGYTRAKEVEQAAADLLGWVDEFVVDVTDQRGLSLVKSGEWEEVVEVLRASLRPLD